MNNLIGISGKMGSGKDTVGKILQCLSANNNLPHSMKFADFNQFTSEYAHKDFYSEYQIKKFANKLKDIVCLLIGCTREQLEDRAFKEKELGEEWWYYTDTLFNRSGSEGNLYVYNEYHDKLKDDLNYYIIKLTPRKLLQLLGTECGREIIHTNIWVNALFADYKSKHKQTYQESTSFNLNDYSVLCKTCDKMFTASNKRAFMCNECVDKQVDIYPNWIITDCRFPNEAKAIKDRGGIVIRVSRDSELEYKHTDESVLSLLNQMGYKDIDDDFSEEAINEGFRWSKTLQKWSFDEDNFQEHSSETALDDYEFDYVIENGGSIEELVEKVKQLKLV